MSRILLSVLLSAACAAPPEEQAAAEPIRYEIRQITRGPSHHFYGYIGHVQNTPWSGDDRYLVALRVGFQDRMPTARDAADIVLLDAQNDYAEEKVEETRAWNPQQGTMLYWNPAAPATQFFFNDRDPATGKVFTVLYDVAQRKRMREYRFVDSPVGNSGVSQTGGRFAAINYARMARLRPVTGYPEAWDWTEGVPAPADDGVFVIDVDSGERRLIASFAQLRDALIKKHPRIVDKPLFINHTLWNRDGERIFFFVRGNFGNRETRINSPMTVRPDGSGLTEQAVFIGGHPEWEFGSRMFGAVDDRLVLYDTDAQQIEETIGDREIFPEPEGDTALSRDGKWLVNGWSRGSETRYTVYRRSDSAWVHTDAFQRGEYTSGELRIDSAPTWNHAGDKVVVPALAADGTRQMWEIAIR